MKIYEGSVKAASGKNVSQKPRTASARCVGAGRLVFHCLTKRAWVVSEEHRGPSAHGFPANALVSAPRLVTFMLMLDSFGCT